jgi:hypothetical protein
MIFSMMKLQFIRGNPFGSEEERRNEKVPKGLLTYWFTQIQEMSSGYALAWLASTGATWLRYIHP